MFILNYNVANSGSLNFIGVESVSPASNFYYVFWMLLPQFLLHAFGNIMVMFILALAIALLIKLVLFFTKISYVDSLKLALLNGIPTCIVWFFSPTNGLIVTVFTLTLLARVILYAVPTDSPTLKLKKIILSGFIIF